MENHLYAYTKEVLQLRAKASICSHWQLESGQQYDGVKENSLFSKHGPLYRQEKLEDQSNHKVNSDFCHTKRLT